LTGPLKDRHAKKVNGLNATPAKWFRRAMVLNEDEVKRIALDDPDVKPLWDSMSGTIWKRTV
jgi:hypothetical protein